MISLTEYSTFGIAIDHSRPINKRARLNTGPFCNYDCEFCYYKDQLDKSDDLSVVMSRVDYIKAYGIDEVDLSGGESSIRKDWFEILDYCSGLKISCVSHGGKFHDLDFLKKSKEKGLSEILFSLHGKNAESHDKIVGRKGAFDRLIKAIGNCNFLKIKVRINITVYDENIDNMPTDLILSLNPSQVNYIAINYSEDNKDFRKINLLDVAKTIKDSIEEIKSSVMEINVRYIPFCYMLGYEEYVMGYYQHIYDESDWNIQLFSGDLDTSVEYTKEEKIAQAYAQAKNNRINEYIKEEGCRECKNLYICDGIKNKMDIYPQEGLKITSPNHYVEQRT